MNSRSQINSQRNSVSGQNSVVKGSRADDLDVTQYEKENISIID